MDDKPKDNRPATEFGEVKVIKNELDPAGRTPEPGAQDKPRKSEPEKTPGSAEG